MVLGDVTLSTVVPNPRLLAGPMEESSYESYVLHITDLEARVFRNDDWCAFPHWRVRVAD